MKKQETGLGKYIYMEWLFPVKDYYCSIRKNEVFFEIIFPLLCALGCTYSYFRLGKVHNALDGLSGLLPTAISILIGFTVMLITLLLTSNGENINKLKAKELKIKVISKKAEFISRIAYSVFTFIILRNSIIAFGFLLSVLGRHRNACMGGCSLSCN